MTSADRLAVVGWTTYRALEQSMKSELALRLETVRNSTVTALELWSEEIRALASVHAGRAEIREAHKAYDQKACRHGRASKLPELWRPI